MCLNVLTVVVCREQQEGGAQGGEGEEEDSQQNNLLDCLVQAQNFALQQAAGNKNFDNNINNFSPQHIMQGEHLSRRMEKILSWWFRKCHFHCLPQSDLTFFPHQQSKRGCE